MKTNLFLFVFFITSFSVFSENEIKHLAYKKFYFELKPYGEWFEIEGGIIAWRPIKISYDWKPYLYGRWCWTEYGWYWDSYEPFGWAVYHYGRWFYDNYYGWIWIPDNIWGPAWVEWRYNDFYIGWAPLPPCAVFKIDIGIHFTIKWYSNFRHWNFVRYEHFCSSNVSYFVERNRIPRIFDRTKYKNEYYYLNGKIINSGIDRKIIENKSRIRTLEYNVNEADDYHKAIRKNNRDNVIFIHRIPVMHNYSAKETELDIRKLDRKIELEKNKIQDDFIVRKKYDGPLRLTNKEWGITIRNNSVQNNDGFLRDESKLREKRSLFEAEEFIRREKNFSVGIRGKEWDNESRYTFERNRVKKFNNELRIRR